MTPESSWNGSARPAPAAMGGVVGPREVGVDQHSFSVHSRRRRRRLKVRRLQQFIGPAVTTLAALAGLCFFYEEVLPHGSSLLHNDEGGAIIIPGQPHIATTTTAAGVMGETRTQPSASSRGHHHRMLLEESNGDNLFPDGAFSDKENKSGGLILYFIGILYTFFALAVVCDEFFVPTLEVIVKRLKISEDVAGATFMAAGGSAPELWASFIGLFISKDEVGFGTIVGSAVFNILFVIGACAFASKEVLQLTWWPLSRDVFFYSTALGLLTVFFWDDKIVLYESLIMVGIYVMYVTFMFHNANMQRRVTAVVKKFRRHFGLTIAEEGGEEAVSEDKLEAASTKADTASTKFGKQTAKVHPIDAGKEREGGTQSMYIPSDDMQIKKEVLSRKVGRRSSTGTLRVIGATQGGMGIKTRRSDTEAMTPVALPNGVNLKRRYSESRVTQEAIKTRVSGEGGLVAARLKFQICMLKAASKAMAKHETPSERFSRAVRTSVRIESIRKTISTMGMVAPGADAPETQSGNWLPTPRASLTEMQIVTSVAPVSNSLNRVRSGPRTPREKRPLPPTEPPPLKVSSPAINESNRDREEVEIESLDLSWPEGFLPQVFYLATAPITYTLYYTLPDVRRPGREPYFMISFFGSIAWIIKYTLCMLWWADILGSTLGIPSVIMGLTLIAAGTSVPDLLTSVIVARHGHGDMAVSSSVGSNLFDVCFGLPIPWTIYILAKGKDVEVGSDLILISILSLFGMLFATVATIAACGWRMTKTMGIVMFCLYFVFMAIMLIADNT